MAAQQQQWTPQQIQAWQQQQMQQQMQQQQMQQQQQQQQAAGGWGQQQAGGATTKDCTLIVTGCTHATVGGIVRGSFQLVGENHGKPAYKKDGQVNGLDVMTYYWDERDGPGFCGWWFGPKVGGDQVWAYHADKNAAMPPQSGWKVPYDGPVDTTFQIQYKPKQAQQQQQQGWGQQQQQWGQQQQQQQQQQWGQQQQGWGQKGNQQQAQQQQGGWDAQQQGGSGNGENGEQKKRNRQKLKKKIQAEREQADR